MWSAVCLGVILCISNLALASTAYSVQTDDSTQVLAEHVTINRIFLMGNKKTKERIIYRELRFKEGEQWELVQLEEALLLDQRQLMNLRLFNSATLDLVPINEREVDIIIRLSERWYIWPSVTFDLGDRSITEWWYNQNRDLSRIQYGAGIDWYNVRGANELLSVKGLFGFTERIRLAYRFPFIDQQQKTGLRLEASYTTNNSVAHSTISNRQAFLSLDTIIYSDLYFSTTFTHRPNFYNTHFLKITYNDRWIADTLAELNPNYFLNGATQQRFFRIQYQLTHDRRDFVSYPLEGVYTEVGIRQQGLGIVSEFTRTSLYGNYTQYYAFGEKKRLFLGNRTSGRLTLQRDQPYNLVQTVGWLKDNVRGYDRYVVDGNHFILNQSNFKYRILRQKINLGKWMPLSQFRVIPIDIYAKTYFDQGYVWHPMPDDTNTFANQYLFGTGIGLDFVTFYDTVFRLEYSINREGERGFYVYTKLDL